jgi:hypothetical protein
MMMVKQQQLPPRPPSQVCGTPHLVRSLYFLSWSRTARHFIEREGSSPCSQMPATRLYEPDKPNQPTSYLFPEDPF